MTAEKQEKNRIDAQVKDTLKEEKNYNFTESDYGTTARSYKDGKHTKTKESIVEFEKTWGHRLLMGISIGMLVIAVLVVLYCALALGKVLGNGGLDTTDFLSTVATALYVTGIVLFALMIPPAIIGIIVSKHPRLVILAYVFAALAILMLIVALIYILATQEFTLFALFVYIVLPLILPILYLVSSIKIGKSNNNVEGKHEISA